MIPRLPFKPVFLQTDNGLEFQERFRAHVKALGLKYHYIHKSTPNENALIERSFELMRKSSFSGLRERLKTTMNYETGLPSGCTNTTMRGHILGLT